MSTFEMCLIEALLVALAAVAAVLMEDMLDSAK